MDYTQGKLGRVFVARIDHEEDLLFELEDLAVNENIRSAFFFLLGATGGASVVTGPKEKRIPPEVTRAHVENASEILGVGNIFREDDKPKIHIHASACNGGDIVMGCFREFTEVFMVIEIVIFEIEGIAAERVFDKDIGFSLMRFYE
jgi:predicted DNA-binding protein with PD1-like motif